MMRLIEIGITPRAVPYRKKHATFTAFVRSDIFSMVWRCTIQLVGKSDQLNFTATKPDGFYPAAAILQCQQSADAM